MANQNLNATQRSCKTESITEVLTRIQRMHAPASDPYYLYLLVEHDWDWLVVLQCMQDNGLFKSNPERPPFAEFARWMEEQHVPCFIARCKARKMSDANKLINGARYPWNDVDWNPHVLNRWRDLYYNLDKLLKAISNHE